MNSEIPNESEINFQDSFDVSLDTSENVMEWSPRKINDVNQHTGIGVTSEIN